MNLESRTRISRAQVVTGAALLLAVVLHFGWCAWSVPRYGVLPSHGVETAACNWGTQLLAAIVGGLAILTAASGALGHCLHSRALGWWLSQLPAVGGWGWLPLGILDPLLRHA